MSLGVTPAPLSSRPHTRSTTAEACRAGAQGQKLALAARPGSTPRAPPQATARPAGGPRSPLPPLGCSTRAHRPPASAGRARRRTACWPPRPRPAQPRHPPLAAPLRCRPCCRRGCCAQLLLLRPRPQLPLLRPLRPALPRAAPAPCRAPSTAAPAPSLAPLPPPGCRCKTAGRAAPAGDGGCGSCALGWGWGMGSGVVPRSRAPAAVHPPPPPPATLLLQAADPVRPTTTHPAW